MKIKVLMNVFNEAKNIAKAIESVHDYVDEIHIFDGAYKEYPHKEIYSTDGTLEIAGKYPKVILHECKKVWENQLEKRSAMFSVGEEGDYFLKLDGDEYVANPEEFRKVLERNLDVGYAWTVSNLYPEPYMVTRFFKYRQGMHYAGRHHWLFDGRNRFIASDQHSNPRFSCGDTPIRIFNFRDSSGLKRAPDKIGFLTNRQKYEGLYTREDQVYPEKFTRLIERPNRAGKPIIGNMTVLREAENPDYTFTLMFTRMWALRRYIDCLKGLKIPKNTEAIIVVDSDKTYLLRHIRQHFEADKRFIGVKIIMTGNPPPQEFTNVRQRRLRIINNWHYIISNARGKYLLGSEDDSLPESHAYMKLINTLEENKADFVQGNIIGRWGSKMCPAWKVIEDESGMPAAVYTAEEKENGIEPIQGCGWYCFVAKTDVFRKYRMDLDQILPLGPDLRFGYMLHKNGFKVIHDWDVKVEHFGEGFSLKIGEQETEQVMSVKTKEGWITKKYDPQWLKDNIIR